VDITSALTGGGLILLLGTVIGYLLNSNRQDRQQYRSEVQGFSTQIEKLETKHAGQIEKLEARIDNLEREVDTERTSRQAAEYEAREAKYQLYLLQGDSG
jgi:outer membrane murein-binding lipoprotein Lpp